MKTVVENAEITFRQQFASYKAITNKSNKDIAEMLGCSLQTVSNMYAHPFTVCGKYILLIQEYLKKEQRKRYE